MTLNCIRVWFYYLAKFLVVGQGIRPSKPYSTPCLSYQTRKLYNPLRSHERNTDALYVMALRPETDVKLAMMMTYLYTTNGLQASLFQTRSIDKDTKMLKSFTIKTML